MLEILTKICIVYKDLCGVISEESIRKNFVLVYEILDEFLDFGYPQLASTDQIKSCIVSEPVIINQPKIVSVVPSTFNNIFNIFKADKIVSGNSSAQSVKKASNEIYVDVIEKLSCLFNTSGFVINSSIDGCIQMKNYLQNKPHLKLKFPNDLAVGKGNVGSVVLDDCNFHESANTAEFQGNKLLKIHPPDGEFIVMNYRITSEFAPPFKIAATIMEISNYKLELILQVKADYPIKNTASKVFIQFPLPMLVSSVYNELDDKAKKAGNSTYETVKKDNIQLVEWHIKMFQGQQEYKLKSNISLQTQANAYKSKKEIGPINVNFEIHNYSVSNMKIDHLKIEQQVNTNPSRWVRYITQSNNYTCRV